jgi:uncharacterized protein YggU (UPF0235/DUF167 family)
MSAVKLELSKNGVLIPVRAKPRARRSQIESVRDGVLVICLTAAPESGKANAAILEVLAAGLRCGKSTLSMARGAKSRDKMICVAALDANEIESRLSEVMPENVPKNRLDNCGVLP